MGGKTKQVPRVKNNARPSSSGRSAELLGSTASNFVGFATHSDFGIVPFAPGFSTLESFPETFDSNITPEYQLILRKLSKKDPVTKVKALHELNSQIQDSDVEVIKTILPLWPKFYHNLSNDVEHRVRESTQTVQSNITHKVGKSIAPYIKLLAPIWIASRFDNYGPAASTALSSFKSSFPPHKIQEVFLFCQNEIIDYLFKNLTFHTASTLSNMKIVTPEDAENKYQRVIISSMKTLCLFLEETTSKLNLEVDEKLQNLLQNQKFWSFVKHKNNNIKSAFFELLCAVIQYAPRLVENKSQVIQVCFQNLDDLDPLTSPHIWECILCIQTTFVDWHEQINFKKVIQPKFNNIFKTLVNGGASSVSRNFLPFLSQLSEKAIKDLCLFEFYTDFFDNIKTIIQTSIQLHSNVSKSDISSLIIAYFECLRYVFKKISNDVEINKSLSDVYPAYLQKYIIDFLQWSLEKDNVLVKIIYKNCAALIAYWAINSKSLCYSELLKSFWSDFLSIITCNISTQNMQEINVKNIIELIRHLYTATPALNDNKVKFGENYNSDGTRKKQNDEMKLKCSNYVASDLKEVVSKIVKTYLENPSKNVSNKYAVQLKLLCQMFGDIDFYINLSPDKNILTTLSRFVQFINVSETLSEDIVDIIFEIISLLDKNEKYQQLQNITKVKDTKAQLWILQRILSYPLCVEPEIREILAEKNVKEKILRVSKEAVFENSTEKFNLIQKCFFQIDSGPILIDHETVEGIINVLLEPLCKPGNETMIDSCGSFIAQLMPVMCTDENTKKEFQYKIFMELFKFSINSTINKNLSEDTLWEISTCWQDSLSSKDVLLNESLLLDCRSIVENKLKSSTELSIQELDNISDSAAQLILNSTKNCNAKVETGVDLLDKEINIFLNFTDLEKKTFNNIDNICKFFESLQNVLTIDNIINDYIQNIEDELLRTFYRKIYFIISVINKITCNENTNIQEDTQIENIENDTEKEEHVQSWENAQLCELISYCLAASALGKSIIENSDLVNNETETVILNLLEKVNLLLKNSSDFSINLLKEKIFKKILNEEIIWLRTLPMFLSTNCYEQYGESGPILLMEEISDSLLNNGLFELYNNLAEVFLPYLNQRSLILNADIIKKADNIKFSSSFLRNVLKNHMSSNNYSEMDDKNLVQFCIKFITETGEKQTINKEKFLYNEDISTKKFKDVIAIVEFIKLLNEALHRFPNELNIKNWDSIRIGLCSWVLTISKSIEKYDDTKVLLFIISVFELFASLSKFIKAEKLKSSTQFHSSVIDEWENVFSKEVNLVLFKNYYSLINSVGNISYLTVVLDKVATCVIHLDYNIIYTACETGFKLNINDLLEFSLDHLLGHRSVRKSSANTLKCISINLMKKDLEKFEKNNETLNAMEKSGEDWHFLKKFEPYLDKYGRNIEKYINEFSYKISELQDLKQIEKEHALTFFYIWDCIIYIFSKSPVELKSLYASWITNNKLENLLLNFIFRAMPLEILKNHDQKSMNNDAFKTSLSESLFQNGYLSIEKCACYMYTQMLRHLPVVLRKWWNGTHARQKNFIDKLTTNYVSNLIWVEDLQAINKTAKNIQENMQITVHQSTREVIAIYSIDEARMELIITLPPNHPLGVIKVEMGKQIGGKTSSRNIGMQLTIFLTHQNGSIFDGLLLWKKNLDKKFSGVEECYVCYTVIHQDTCQLPKLTCKTCKKKFHGPCLYKWFTTSSKSTCPLCRNVF